MTYSTQLYNELPSLGKARDRLTTLDSGLHRLFKSLIPIFNHHPQFGVCLIHAHCTLHSDEKMVSTGRVSEPVLDTASGENRLIYPERWLSNGVPYEFSSTPTVEVRDELVEAFQDRMKSFEGKDLSDLFGIYYIHRPDDDRSGDREENGEDIIWLERTVGRKNIVEPVTRDVAMAYPMNTPAAWEISAVHMDADGKFETGRICTTVCVGIPAGHAARHSS